MATTQEVVSLKIREAFEQALPELSFWKKPSHLKQIYSLHLTFSLVK
jgi:hypothetical protein